MLGARIIAAASTEDKRAFARGQGADQAVDYTAEDWRKTLASTTDDQPMDVVFDAVGGDISPVAFRTLGWRGRHLVVGFAGGKIPALPFNIALLKGASLIGVDSAQIRRQETEVYARGTNEIASWLCRQGWLCHHVVTSPLTSAPLSSLSNCGQDTKNASRELERQRIAKVRPSLADSKLLNSQHVLTCKSLTFIMRLRWPRLDMRA